MISGFAPARLLRSAERVLRIQRGQDKAAGIAAVRACSAVLSGAASDDARQSMQARESGVVAFGLGLKVRGGGRSAWLALEGRG